VAFAFGYFVRGMPAADLFFAVVGIAVAAVPEGLPAIVTIALAVGMERMARRKAIVRYLAAVETLGAVGVICSDKTGTFTRNEMTVEAVVVGSGTYRVAGHGYEPRGSITPADTTSSTLPADVVRLAAAAAHCNDARLVERSGQWLAEGDPMEAALLAFAAKAGADIDGDRRRRDGEIPFDPAYRFMATLARAPDGPRVFVKGAPEQVLAMCNRVLSAGGGDLALDPAPWRAAIDTMTARGLRVLAMADGNAAAGAVSPALTDFDGRLRLIGLAGLMDPPREEAIAAVADCRAAGIAVKMITGDHIGTARAIAARLGLARPDAAMSGAALAGVSDAELPAVAAQVDVFARTSPEDKLRLVRALQQDGAVVAMTGDGVNDSPALKQADVGVAMGLRGSAAAREVARIVLADDNFATIAAAVEEGRRVYDNLRKAIAFILPTNGGEAFAIIAAIALGVTAPISPLHILWINLITEITLSLALAFEAAEPDIMRRPPRRPNAPILTGYIIWRIVLVTLLMLAGTFAVFEWLLRTGASLDYARTAAVNTIVAMEAAYLLSVRRLRGPGWSGLFRRSAWVTWIAIAVTALAEIAFTYLAPMNELFASAPLRPSAWILVALAAAALFALSEIEKHIFGSRQN
jgi:magnesium-transporting ATPase (P-type)